MVSGDSKSDISFPRILVNSAKAANFAEACTLPFDYANVRSQLEKKAALAGDGIPKYMGMGMRGTLATFTSGCSRQYLFGCLRIGLYDPIKNFYVGDNFVGDVPLTTKILAALTAGAFATSVANPPGLVKVLLQTQGMLAPYVRRRYSGVPKHIALNAIMNAAELATYDQLKQTILKIPGFTDNVLTHLLSGLGAGFVATCVGSPVDVVKLRMMGDPTYTGTIDCFVKTLKNDGPFAFYKGFVPNFARLGSRNVIMFLTLEQAKKFPHDPPN